VEIGLIIVKLVLRDLSINGMRFLRPLNMIIVFLILLIFVVLWMKMDPAFTVKKDFLCRMVNVKNTYLLIVTKKKVFLIMIFLQM